MKRAFGFVLTQGGLSFLLLAAMCSVAWRARAASAADTPVYAPLRDRVVTNTARVVVRNVSGRAILRGVPPPEKVITMDSACAKLNSGLVTTRHYVVGEGGALADVFIYLKDAPATPAPAGATPVMEPISCQFQPYVLGVQTGQTMELRSNDPVLENVHLLPKNPGNRERNIGLFRGKTTPISFDAAELFLQIKCDVHPWMYAYICVVDHPWFAVTDQKGNFTLPPGLPPGQYTLVAAHRKAGEQTQRIRVNADGAAVPVTFILDVPER